MELMKYLRVLLRKWWVIALACVVTVTSAVVFSEIQPPIYRSSAVLQVIPARYDYGLTLAAEQLLRQFANQIHTTSTAQQVIDELQLDITVDKLLAGVTVASIPEDFLIQVDADRPDRGGLRGHVLEILLVPLGGARLVLRPLQHHPGTGPNVL